MAKTLVQTSEEVQSIHRQIEAIVLRFEREFGERLLIKSTSDGDIEVGISICSNTEPGEAVNPLPKLR